MIIRKEISVLVVDECTETREWLRMVLTREGYEVYVAVNGKQGLAQALDLEPDLVILDTNSPSPGGIELLKYLKSTLSCAKILVLTGSSRPRTLLEAKLNGASGFLLKPPNIEVLIDTVFKLTNLNRGISDHLETGFKV